MSMKIIRETYGVPAERGQRASFLLRAPLHNMAQFVVLAAVRSTSS